MASVNPYAAPAARVADAGTEAAPPIWNPNAAASWSVLFSPAFGSFLHMLNWRSLGEAQKASVQKGWFIASLVMLAIYVILGFAAPALDTRFIGFAYLLVWYFGTAKAQARYVKERFGNDYPRKGWAKALGIALLAVIGYVVVAVIVGIIAAAGV